MVDEKLKSDIKRLSRDLDAKGKKKSVIREYVEALLLAVFLAFLIRSFVVEPFKIPSKSMVPTLLVGDHIFVNKFTYGLRIPGTKKWLFEMGDPKRGEVIVFIYPEDEKLDFIKRVIGVPGDHIRIHQGRLYVNDKEILEQDIPILGVDPKDKRRLLIARAEANEMPSNFERLPYYRGYENYKIQMEDLDNYQHLIQRSRLIPNNEELHVVVPEGHYFVMGDNRDQSADSRVWGFVPRENLKGRAMVIWLSLDADRGGGFDLRGLGRELFKLGLTFPVNLILNREIFR